ncbi:uncharacterized protein LOC133320772 [Danaus plexippus]|uniref:uncharacterized protein LOC133320772 n=1 Tax=Danaus plexippus TaxID=13037 RepID=UPI002AAF7639|nr:uncharacterized protein LOC133320772 [Danaus plexippus]
MFQIKLIYFGLIWFIVSSSSVIVNDIFAYIFGIFFGKTQLIKLSPKKTVEGFTGASLITLIWAVVVGALLVHINQLICPENNIKVIMIREVWIHFFVLGFFAAFFAPFGGFLASGLKRYLRIKDFGDSIPGHGGIADRFDCQLIMGMFSYLYVKT